MEIMLINFWYGMKADGDDVDGNDRTFIACE